MAFSNAIAVGKLHSGINNGEFSLKPVGKTGQFRQFARAAIVNPGLKERRLALADQAEEALSQGKGAFYFGDLTQGMTQAELLLIEFVGRMNKDPDQTPRRRQ